MGRQCSIILTYYTEKHHEIGKIKDRLDIKGDQETELKPLGNRAWDPTDMQFHAFSMRDWDEEQCNNFFDFLKTIDWDQPESVQIYYTPAKFTDHAQLFNYIKLFPSLKLEHPDYFPFSKPDPLVKGDILSLDDTIKAEAKTNFNYAEIEGIDRDGHIVACFIEEYYAQGKKIRYLKEHPGHSISFRLP